MNLAFWRTKDAAVAAKADADDAQDPAAALHVRTRRRLIGAAALLLTAVIVLPMVLDSTPRPVSDTVAIDIPSDKTPFAPRLSSTTPAAPPPPAEPVAQAPARTEEPPRKAEAKSGEEQRKEAPPKETPQSPTAGASQGAFALQAAALASETAAHDLAARLKKAGFAAYTEKVSTKKGDRIRVRVGPFATREDAEQARTKLKALGIEAGVVSG